LAAVLIAASALWLPDAFKILDGNKIKIASLIEMGLGVVIGAITFTGSIVAFLKLNGNMNSKLVLFKDTQKVTKYSAYALGAFLLLFFIFGSKFFFILLTLLALFIGFMLIGMTGFGGVLPIARRAIVDRRRWLTQEQFSVDLAVAQLLPGPNIVNLSVAIGLRFAGLPGAVAAFTAILAVPMLILLGLLTLYARSGDIPAVAGALLLPLYLGPVPFPISAVLSGLVNAALVWAAGHWTGALATAS
jgi:chromate transport protein ChrA